MKLKSLTLAIALGLLVLVSLFTVGLTVSEFPPDPEGEYSPWGDLNDDGIIDIFDIVWLASRYDKTGTPVNKTELVYECNATYTRLLDKLQILEERIDLLNSTIAELASRVEGLENQTGCINGSVTVGTPLVWILGADAPGDTTVTDGMITLDLDVEPGTPMNFTEALFLKNTNLPASNLVYNVLLTVSTAISPADFTECKMHIYQNATGDWQHVYSIDLTLSHDALLSNLGPGEYFRMTFEVSAITGASGAYPFEVQLRYCQKRFFRSPLIRCMHHSWGLNFVSKTIISSGADCFLGER